MTICMSGPHVVGPAIGDPDEATATTTTPQLITGRLLAVTVFTDSAADDPRLVLKTQGTASGAIPQQTLTTLLGLGGASPKTFDISIVARQPGSYGITYAYASGDQYRVTRPGQYVWDRIEITIDQMLPEDTATVWLWIES